MKNPPSFSFYPQDFIADFNVINMSMEERGIYITLLCNCWIEDGLPAEDSDPMASLFKSDKVAKCFIKKNGRFRNPRLDKERQKQLIFHKSQQAAGLRGAAKRWGRHSKPIATPMGSDSSSSSSSSSIKEEEFSAFWDRYPRKTEKKVALKAYTQAIKAGATPDELLAAVNGYRVEIDRLGTGEKYIKHASTFLHEDRWRDYLPKPKMTAAEFKAQQDAEMKKLRGE